MNEEAYKGTAKRFLTEHGYDVHIDVQEAADALWRGAKSHEPSQRNAESDAYQYSLGIDDWLES